MGYDIVATDSSLEFNQVTPDYKKSFPLDYRPIYNAGQIKIHSKDTQQLVMKITDIAQVDSITDNRTGGAGGIALPASVTLLYDIIKPFFFHSLASGDSPFILLDGSINPSAFGGVGNFRADALYPNAVGVNGEDPDQDDAFYPKEIRFPGVDYINLISQKSSNLVIQTDTTDNAFYLTTDLGVEGEGVVYVGDSTAYFGTNGALISSDKDLSAALLGTWVGAKGTYMALNGVAGGGGIGVIYADNTGGVVKSINQPHRGLLLGTQNSTFNEDVTNSILATGSGLVANKNDYLFLENLEVQGGIAICTVQPEVLAGWTDLSYTTRGYVDSKEFAHTNKAVNYTAVDRDFVRMTTGASDKTVTLPVVAGNSGVQVIVKKVDAGAGNLIIDGDGAETIDGELTQTIFNQFTSLTFYCNGTTWDLI